MDWDGVSGLDAEVLVIKLYNAKNGLMGQVVGLDRRRENRSHRKRC
jgi:hypothetical protein